MNDSIKWYDVPNFPSYEANHLGQVRNKTSKKEIKPIYNKTSKFWTVKLKMQPIPLHKVIFNAFHPDLSIIDVKIIHLDGDRSNNTISNLSWKNQEAMELITYALQACESIHKTMDQKKNVTTTLLQFLRNHYNKLQNKLIHS